MGFPSSVRYWRKKQVTTFWHGPEFIPVSNKLSGRQLDQLYIYSLSRMGVRNIWMLVEGSRECMVSLFFRAGGSLLCLGLFLIVCLSSQGYAVHSYPIITNPQHGIYYGRRGARS